MRRILLAALALTGAPAHAQEPLKIGLVAPFSGTAAELSFLHPHLGDLPMIFIVSEVELRPAPADAEAGLRVAIERASGVKCERCWRYVRSVSSDSAWAGLCERCQEALAEPVNG